MSVMQIALVADRALPFVLFALYMVTAVRICRYSAWCAAGAPNPFLPRSMRPVVIRVQRDLQ